MMQYGYDGYGMMGVGLWMMCIFWSIFWIILIGIAVYIFNKRFKNSNARNLDESDKSFEILNERLARGEIEEEEYTKIKNVLINSKNKKT
jgi:putative membrane protein